MLVLPIKKKWFDMIKSGEKKEEYREIKEYWNKRFGKVFSIRTYEIDGKMFIRNNSITNPDLGFIKPQYILFRNGYGKDRPIIRCLVNIFTGTGKEEWGAEPNKEYYILEILEILEVKNGTNR